jgi:hypothetical protein
VQLIGVQRRGGGGKRVHGVRGRGEREGKVGSSLTRPAPSAAGAIPDSLLRPHDRNARRLDGPCGAAARKKLDGAERTGLAALFPRHSERSGPAKRDLAMNQTLARQPAQRGQSAGHRKTTRRQPWPEIW